MKKFLRLPAVSLLTLSVLSACGDDHDYYHGGGAPVAPSPTSYVGTTGVFVASADADTGDYAAAPIGSYAGKRQILRGSLDFLTGQNVGQPAGVEVYKGSDGHIHALDLVAIGGPVPQQLSTEAAATVDDTCSLTGTGVAGADTDYAGVYFTADLVVPTNSTYIYRLPGADGACNTADDVFHMVKTGMLPTDAPITVTAMPVATVRTATGGIAGFVIKSGASLALVDANFANPVILGTFAAPIGVATALSVGTVQGYPTGQLYVVDGNIVYVDYVAHTTSASLYSIPNWTPTDTAASFAASPTTLYFSSSIPASALLPASATVYAMPADGSAAPAAVEAFAGRITELQFPVQSTNLIFSVASTTYAIRALPASGGPSVSLATSTGNGGSFTATATNVYYTTWTASTDATTHVVTHSGTQSGIVGVDAVAVQPLLANSSFLTGGEQAPWPADTITTQTPYVTVFQITGLTPVTVSNTATGTQYVEDGVSGGVLTSIDAATNQPIATLGTLPTSTATFLSGTFRGADDVGFIEATTPVSTQDPATRDLYLIDSHNPQTLLRITGNL